MSLEAFIREEASRLGFVAVGFAAVGDCQTFSRFQDWFKRGYAAGMDYLARNVELRSNPRLLAPAARSVIVAAFRYPAAGHGRPFSNYALGRDYHEVLREKLSLLLRSLEARCNVPLDGRICVDSAPVLEREWAARAGLGWIGRQGSLVHPEWGCSLFLGELFVNLELEPSLPMQSKCGNCRRCADACPTGAIQPDRLVDARRCIAYLTIEHKGKIPEELRPRLGGSLFGCDRCTSVCPFNPDGDAGILPEFLAGGSHASGGSPAAMAMPTAEQCLAMSATEFRQKFRGTAVYRSGLARLKRNASVALANRGISRPH